MSKNELTVIGQALEELSERQRRAVELIEERCEATGQLIEVLQADREQLLRMVRGFVGEEVAEEGTKVQGHKTGEGTKAQRHKGTKPEKKAKPKKPASASGRGREKSALHGQIQGLLADAVEPMSALAMAKALNVDSGRIHRIINKVDGVEKAGYGIYRLKARQAGSRTDLCRCGHERGDHLHGQGDCSEFGCSCSQFRLATAAD